MEKNMTDLKSFIRAWMLLAVLWWSTTSVRAGSWTNATSPERATTSPLTTKVGIGNASPLGVLDVTANIASTDALTVDQLQSSGNLLNIMRASTTKFVISNAGLVGIGNSSPNGILDVRGVAASSGAGLPIILSAQQGAASGNGGDLILSSGAPGTGGANGSILFATGGTFSSGVLSAGEKMRIATDGSIGIGTSTPASVNGRNKVMEISAAGISSTAHPGIVFRSGSNFSTNPAWEIMLSSGSTSTTTDFSIQSGTNTRLIVAGPTGNVGIGASAPIERLDVLGGIRSTDGANGVLSMYGDSQGARLVVGKLQGGTRDFRIDDASNGEHLRVTSGGNVGIGNTAPTEKLDISGGNVRVKALSSAGSFVLDGNAGATGSCGTDCMRIGNPDASTTVFWREGTSVMALQDGGNVGIGTSTPSTKLDVNGNANVNGSLTVANRSILTGNTAGQEAMIVNQAQATGSIADFRQGNTSQMTLTNGGSLGLGTTTPQEKLDVKGGARITDGANGVLTMYGDNQGVRMVVGKLQGGTRDFRLEDATNGERLRVTSGGSVGIGTSSPLEKLDIVGGGIRSTDGINGVLSMYGDNQGARLVIGKLQGGTRDFRIEDATNGERFRITSGGNVGVGVTNPLASMHIRAMLAGAQSSGLMLDNETSTGQGAAMIFRARNASDQTVEMARIVGEGLNPMLRFYTSNSSGVATERISVDQNGMVNMSGTLNVANRAIVTGNVAGSEAMIVNQAQASGPIVDFRQGNTSKMILANDGSLGVGTATPVERLDVKGGIRASDGMNGVVTMYGDYLGVRMVIGKLNGGTRDFRIEDASNGESFRVTSAGNVGIGTTTPASKLDVNGNVNVTGSLTVASVKTNSWTINTPDYVFEKDYRLASLDHVEKYVKEQKHLPEIPSAEEMKKKGMDLAEMNLRLLKKVEELTLYSIQQEKRMRQQERELSVIKRALKIKAEEKL